jgi:hypothetical protein
VIGRVGPVIGHEWEKSMELARIGRVVVGETNIAGADEQETCNQSLKDTTIKRDDSDRCRRALDIFLLRVLTRYVLLQSLSCDN